MPRRSVAVRIETISHPPTAEVIFAVKAELMRVGLPCDVIEDPVDPNQNTSISEKASSLVEKVTRTMRALPFCEAYIHINNAQATFETNNQSKCAHMLLTVSAGVRAPYRFRLLVDEDDDVPVAVLRSIDAQAVMVHRQLPILTQLRDPTNVRFVESVTDLVCDSIFRWGQERGKIRPN